ncbi:MAG: hypothetical protein HQK83_04940 [Fibrobacteria bacterium]|nr:hypothetical protein [Fibrobacteria bacterium]
MLELFCNQLTVVIALLDRAIQRTLVRKVNENHRIFLWIARSTDCVISKKMLPMYVIARRERAGSNLLKRKSSLTICFG